MERGVCCIAGERGGGPERVEEGGKGGRGERQVVWQDRPQVVNTRLRQVDRRTPTHTLHRVACRACRLISTSVSAATSVV